MVNLQAGFSDAWFYRHAAVSSVVYGVAPNGMGGADEYATVKDVKAVYAVHAMAISRRMIDAHKCLFPMPHRCWPPLRLRARLLP